MCVYGINVGAGANGTLGCRVVVVGGSPTGALDSVHTSPGSVQVTGWAIDPDTAGTDTVHIYIDGVAIVIPGGRRAPRHRAGVPALRADPRLQRLDAGERPACTASASYGINVAGVRRANTTLGCHTVGVPG